MLTLISPSKTLSKRSAPANKSTTPEFIDEAEQLVAKINAGSKNLSKLLGVSTPIAELNRTRFAEWKASDHTNGKPAIFAYAGDVYNGLAAFDMSSKDVSYAQNQLRILSGLYGSLRPLDNILPYRLEMSTRLAGSWGSNLYHFWGDKIAKDVEPLAGGTVLNCASNEYAKAVLPHLGQEMTVITPKFLHDSGSGPRVKMTFAKYTRGLMARWAIENKVEKADDLLNFDAEGYVYAPKLSEPGSPAFVAPADFSLLGRFTKF